MALSKPLQGIGNPRVHGYERGLGSTVQVGGRLYYVDTDGSMAAEVAEMP